MTIAVATCSALPPQFDDDLRFAEGAADRLAAAILAPSPRGAADGAPERTKR